MNDTLCCTGILPEVKDRKLEVFSPEGGRSWLLPEQCLNLKVSTGIPKTNFITRLFNYFLYLDLQITTHPGLSFNTLLSTVQCYLPPSQTALWGDPGRDPNPGRTVKRQGH